MNFSPFSFLLRGKDTLCQAVTQCLRLWMKPNNHDPVLNVAMDLTRNNPELLLENMLLRQQLIKLKRQAKRPVLTWRDRTLFPMWQASCHIGNRHS